MSARNAPFIVIISLIGGLLLSWGSQFIVIKTSTINTSNSSSKICYGPASVSATFSCPTENAYMLKRGFPITYITELDSTREYYGQSPELYFPELANKTFNKNAFIGSTIFWAVLLLVTILSFLYINKTKLRY